jgi:thiol-disulfide isomerase/thioredoxin
MPLNRNLLFLGVALAIVTVAAVVVYSLFAADEPAPSAPTAGTGAALGAVGQFVALDTPVAAPALKFTDEKGKSLTLADFRGKVVVLNLWATWCTPCLAEMPMLDRLQKQLGEEGVIVIALSLDRGGKDVVSTFYSQAGIRHLGIFLDPSMRSISDARTSGLPTTLLINADGMELGRVTGPMEWDAQAAIDLVRKALPPAAGK